MIHGIALALVLTASAQVSLRGGEAAPAGDVVLVDAAGVWLGPPPAGEAPTAKTGTGADATKGAAQAPSGPVLGISWDRVKSVQGAMAQQATPFKELADQAWRARTRLERGDFVSAESLFEQLFDRYRWQTGPTAAVVCEGLVRCRLHRGAHVLAIEPWLSLLRATGTPTAPILHANWAPEAGLAPVIDPVTGLAPALPPIWLAWTAVQTYGGNSSPGLQLKPGDKGSPPLQSDAKVQMLAAIYLQSARAEAGLSATLPDLATNDAGVGFAWQILAARIGTPEQRDAARRQLSDRLKPAPASAGSATPAWQEAWTHAAIGRSLVREDSPELKRLGVIELLNVPARYSRVHPYLAGIALAEASETLRGLGDKAGADVLAAELLREYPAHPVLDWGPMRSFVPKPQAAQPKPAQPSQVPGAPETKP